MKNTVAKKVLYRALLGVPIGIALSYLITIAISLCLAGGDYAACVPALAEDLGSEIGAVMLQAGLSALMGAAFSATSVIWEFEHWSILKQSLVYFLIAAIAMLPTAYFCHWMEHSVAGVLEYLAIFVGTFVVVWLSRYFCWKRSVARMNEAMEKQK